MDHQAFAQLLGNYGEFFGAIAVVITLGYLAFQVRQNTNALRLNGFQAWGEQINQLNLRNTDPEFAEVTRRAMTDPSQLTDTEWVQIGALALSNMHAFEMLFEGYRAGMVSQQLWEAEERSLTHWIALPVISRWWELNPMAFTDDFRAHVDTLRRERPEEPSRMQALVRSPWNET